jgi:hypothetical protein
MTDQLKDWSGGPLTRVELLIVLAVAAILATMVSSTLLRIHRGPPVAMTQPLLDSKFVVPNKVLKPGALPLGSNGFDAESAMLPPHVWHSNSEPVSQNPVWPAPVLPSQVDLGLDLGQGVVPPSPWIQPSAGSGLSPGGSGAPPGQESKQ